MTQKIILRCVGVVLAIILVCVMFSALGLGGRLWGNAVNYAENKIDEATKYELLKEVEDTCRAMISSYNSDRITWEQYKDGDNEEKQGWAEQAKMRANRTASTYNNYILENNYLWGNNVPEDIASELEYIE